MNVRTVVVASVALLVPAAATPALATRHRPSSRPVACNLITDDRGDAVGGPLGMVENPAGNEPSYDIVSADVASDGRTVTAVVRVAALADRSLATAPTGMHWRLDFGVRGSMTRLYLQAFSTPFGDNFELGYVAGSTSNSFTDADVRGVFDLQRNEVRISAPVKAARPEVFIASNSVIDRLHAYAGPFYNVAGRHPSLSDRGDEAASRRTYQVGTKSCVTPGR